MGPPHALGRSATPRRSRSATPRRLWLPPGLWGRLAGAWRSRIPRSPRRRTALGGTLLCCSACGLALALALSWPTGPRPRRARGGPRKAPEPPVPAPPAPLVLQDPPPCNASEGTCAPRCAGRWAPAGALGQLPGPRLWFAGCLAPPWGAKSGLNNQRHTVMAVLMVAERAGATLVLGDYAVNAHDLGARLAWDDFFDMPRLRRGLQGRLVPLREAGGCIPPHAGTVRLRAHWTGGHDLEEVVRDVHRAGSDAELAVHHTLCGGHPFLRFRHSAPGVLARADAFLRGTVAFAPPLLQRAGVVLEALRRSAEGGAVHCLHQRIKYAADHMHFPFAPLMNCTDVFHRMGKCDPPVFLGCLCSSAVTHTSLVTPRLAEIAMAEGGPAQLQREMQRPRYLDFDWRLRTAVAEGAVRRGDTVYIATNDPDDLRVQFTRDEAAKQGLRALAAPDVGRLDPAAGRALRGPSQVVSGAVEQALCSIVPGRFYGSCLSSVSEIVSDTRRWAGDPSAERDHQLFIALQSTNDLGQLFRTQQCRNPVPRPGSRSVRRKVYFTAAVAVSPPAPAAHSRLL